MRVVDRCAHGNGLDEVGGLAEHRAQFAGLTVVTRVLFTAGRGPRVDDLLLVLCDHAGKVEGDRTRRARTTGTRRALLLVYLETARTAAVAGGSGSVLELEVVEIGLYVRDIDLAASFADLGA